LRTRVSKMTTRVLRRMHYEYYQNGSYVGSENVDNGYADHGEVRSITDVPHPGFRKRISAGESISSPCSRLISSLSETPSSVNYLRRDAISSYLRVIQNGLFSAYCSEGPSTSSLMPWASADLPTRVDSAIVSAYAKMNSPVFQGQVFAAEALKTLAMLRHPLASLQKLTASVLTKQKSLVRQGLSVSKASANAWLEYRYGWKPLMLDVKDFSSALGTERFPNKVLRSSSASNSSFRKDWNGRVYDGSYSRVLADLHVEYDSRVKAGVRYRIHDPDAASFENLAFGLSLNHLPSTLWELVPYSFVVDWFVNVGDWLNAIIPNPNIHILSNYSSTLISESRSLRYTGVEFRNGYDNTWSSTGTSGNLSRSLLSYSRTVDIKVPSLPTFNPNLTLVRSVDSAALVINKCLSDLRRLRI